MPLPFWGTPWPIGPGMGKVRHLNILRILAPVVLATTAIAAPQVASAQSEWPVDNGDYVEITGIVVDDGHELEYTKWLATEWRKSADFAVSKGWLSSYEIMYNVNPRKGEPTLYLVRRFPNFPTSAEEDARDKAYREWDARTESQMQAASAGRAEFRHVSGSMLLREVTWK